MGLGTGVTYPTSGDALARHVEVFAERPLNRRLRAQARFAYVWASRTDSVSVFANRAYDRKRYHGGVGVAAHVASLHGVGFSVAGGFDVRGRDEFRPARGYYPLLFKEAAAQGQDLAAEIIALCRTLPDCTSRLIEYDGSRFEGPGTYLFLSRHFGGFQFGTYLEPEVSARMGAFRLSALVGVRYHFVKSKDAAGTRFDALAWHTGVRVARRF